MSNKDIYLLLMHLILCEELHVIFALGTEEGTTSTHAVVGALQVTL
jgi:hypothetical protein